MLEDEKKKIEKYWKRKEKKSNLEIERIRYMMEPKRKFKDVNVKMKRNEGINNSKI